jgi:hypothetical protein
VETTDFAASANRSPEEEEIMGLVIKKRGTVRREIVMRDGIGHSAPVYTLNHRGVYFDALDPRQFGDDDPEILEVKDAEIIAEAKAEWEQRMAERKQAEKAAAQQAFVEAQSFFERAKAAVESVKAKVKELG